mmetsp:Transcript_26/g.79  ORF Transcript_26/g.79 Transcript_26/m.79 type:complete len:230 (+) Transcript_26:441-1130(+)
MLRDRFRNSVFLVEENRSLVCPTARHVVDGVTTAAQHKKRNTKAFDDANTLSMTARGQVEHPEAITGERVRSALKYHRPRLEDLHDLVNHRLEDTYKLFVGDALLEWEVDRVALAFSRSNVANVTSFWEKVSVLVEAAGHYSIGCPKRVLNTVTVMNVDVNVENTRMELQELENGEDDVVYVAEPAPLPLHRVMQAPRPVDRNVGEAVVEAHRAVEATPCVQAAKVKQV